MREIKFRGISIDTGKMVYGDLLQYRVYPVIFDKNKKQHEVKATTVGQFTGLKDKRGVEIYKGDVVKLTKGNKEIQEVEWGICLWQLKEEEEDAYHIDLATAVVLGAEVIGNIYSNPELMERIK